MSGPARDLSAMPSLGRLLPRVCPGCRDAVAFAVTGSADSFYLGWICSRCLAADVDGILDVVGVYARREDADWDLLTKEYCLQAPDPGLADAPTRQADHVLKPLAVRQNGPVLVRSETPTDYEEIRALVSDAMRANDAELVELIRESENHIPDLALVAEEGGRIVGYVLFSYVTLEGVGKWPVLALAPLCVRPDRQRQGVGAALVRAGLERADVHGAPLVTVLGHPDYYRRFGFEPSRQYGIEPPSDDIPDGVFMVKPLSGYRDEFKGRVVYPAAFDVT